MGARFVRLDGSARNVFASWLRNDYATGASIDAIARRYDISAAGVNGLLHLAATPMRAAHGHPRSRGPHRDRLAAELRRQHETGVSTRRLGARYGISRTTVITLIREAGGHPTRPRKLTNEQAARAALSYLEGERPETIAAALGVAHTTLYETLDTMHVPRRRKRRRPCTNRGDEHQDHDEPGSYSGTSNNGNGGAAARGDCRGASSVVS